MANGRVRVVGELVGAFFGGDSGASRMPYNPAVMEQMQANNGV